MEPVTHFLTGACLARTGFNRKAAYATLAMCLAAEAPDLDTLWSLKGPIAVFQHHRDITHTFLGLPFEAAFVVAIVYLIHLWRTRRGMTTKAPTNWPLLWLFCLIALLSHIFLDWTNNYGVRPFFPFNPHWYAGSFVFIFEPVLFALLLLAFIAPALFGLINSEIGARKQPFRGRGWAIFALLAIVALWAFRYIERDRADQLARAQDYGAEVLRVDLNPYPIDPFHWHAVVTTHNFYQLATINTLNNAVASEQADRFYKPAETPATQAAKQSRLGHVYLDWSQDPLVLDSGISTDPDHPNLKVVTFEDLRFLYDTLLFKGRERPPLTGTAFVDVHNNVVRMEMDGKPQR